ncbi:hypothetical protein D0Z03_000339 [Geotrichum reessii]|nr:hypothetical protein D0Z03_000339 [Galactomyces reessii]
MLRLLAGSTRCYHHREGPPTLSKLSQVLIPAAATPAAEKDLLARYGYTRQVSAGTFHLLPLGHLVHARIEAILRRHMVEGAAGSEVSLASMTLPALWEKTGRANNTELFRLKDGRGTEFLLAPTHEEEITSLVAREVASYRRLPLRLFQITRKYRDERRPRGGLLRGREFTMKDMYSFDLTPEAAHKTYKEVQTAYNAFFTELCVPFVVAEADSGSIGGSLSHEYHYLSPHGEDTVVTCPSCKYTANEEKAVSQAIEDAKPAVDANVEYRVSADRSTLVAAYFPLDRAFNPLLLDSELPGVVDSSVGNSQQALELFMAGVTDDTDMFDKRLVRVMDARIDRTTNLPDLPFRPSRSTTTTLIDVPLVAPVDGECCPSCDEPGLTTTRAIEVGHTFYLGTKYSAPLEATVATAEGGAAAPSVVEMGCYGIGVSRLLSAIALHCHDADGLVWPRAVAPYDAVVVAQDIETGILVTNTLRAAGISAVLDDRIDSRFGQKLREARAIGIPFTVVAGKVFKQTGLLEIQPREKTVDEIKAGTGVVKVSLDQAVDFFQNL